MIAETRDLKHVQSIECRLIKRAKKTEIMMRKRVAV